MNFIDVLLIVLFVWFLLSFILSYGLTVLTNKEHNRLQKKMKSNLFRRLFIVILFPTFLLVSLFKAIGSTLEGAIRDW